MQHTIQAGGVALLVHSLNTLIVGSGAAALRAAEALYDRGQRDIALLTEGLRMGTSRNTGSDKQTYYKLTLAGDTPDSVADLAQTLFDGGALHGDIALVQAALSARCFLHLVEIGVPFPHNLFGEYAGYRTDHDARLRATSAGPLTSRFMTERLEEQVRRRGIRIFDRYLAVGILTDGKAESPAAEQRVIGLIALDLNRMEPPYHGVTLFNCTNVVYATGGPAGIYRHSVYPESQTGALGIALEAGARAVNLTESQYGIASVKYRWNLSGTYQQVLPRYLSTDQERNDVREFLRDWYPEPGPLLDAIFLKGYQWPFDPAKTGPGGSSVIDLLVGMETARGRRVFLDFTRNPATRPPAAETACPFDFSLLGPEAYGYLKRSGALFGCPIDRLRHMNPPAIELYRRQGIDLETEWLEIAVCAQHNNGGLSADIWWESNLRRFFPIGEVNGSFGIHRPGGSALNATQVGALRAAQRIAARYGEAPLPVDAFFRLAEERTMKIMSLIQTMLSGLSGPQPSRPADPLPPAHPAPTPGTSPSSGTLTVAALRNQAAARMSDVAAHIRPVEALDAALEEAAMLAREFPSNVRLESLYELPDAFRLRDILLTRYAFLASIRQYVLHGGGSRGSSLVVEAPEKQPADKSELPGRLRARPENKALRAFICETDLHAASNDNGRLSKLACRFNWVLVRGIPRRDNWFENVWRDFREGFPEEAPVKTEP